MEIIISKKTEDYLKSFWKTTNITPSIQSVVDNYITSIVEKHYTEKIKKNIDQKIDELNKPK